MRIRFIPIIFIYYSRVHKYIYIFYFFFLFFLRVVFSFSYIIIISVFIYPLQQKGRGALNEKNFFACFCQASRGIAFCNLWLNVLPSKNPLSKLDLSVPLSLIYFSNPTPQTSTTTILLLSRCSASRFLKRN